MGSLPLTILIEIARAILAILTIVITRWLMQLSSPEEDIKWLESQAWYRFYRRLKWYRGDEFYYQYKFLKLIRQ